MTLKKHQIVVPLPRTDRYQLREVDWTYFLGLSTLMGVMEVRERLTEKSRRPRVRRYSLMEELSADPGVRRFRITKPLAAGGGKYFVCLNPRGHDECDCTGALSTNCVHATAVRALAGAGVLPGGTPAPPPVGGTGGTPGRLQGTPGHKGHPV